MMPFKKTNLKFTISMNKYFTSFLFAFFLVVGFAQDSLQTQSSLSQRLKVDGVAAVVGDYVILESDVDKTLIDLQSQGVSVKDIERCSLLGKLMEDKLYAHHAEQDSLEVSKQDIDAYVDQTIDYFVQQLGSVDKVLEFYKKKDEQSFRDELFEINKTQQLAQKMQAKVVEEVELTPEEVRQFFNNISVSERPVFGAELEVAQIVIEPQVSQEATDKIIKQLEAIRRDVLENGSSFSTKAILYSQDPGSRSRGGKYTLYRKRPQMVKEFRDAAFRLQEGEISDPFKTDFGWHIVMVDKIRGQEVDVRHILLIPEVTPQALQDAKEKIQKIRKRLIDSELTFEEAARSFSDEKETRANGGLLINPSTGDTRFELTKMDPVFYSQVQKLKDNEISTPLIEESRTGVKKYKILKVTNRFDEHVADYVNDYTRVKELALKEKQLKTIQKWMAEKIQDTYVSVNEDNKNCDFSNKWIKE